MAVKVYRHGDIVFRVIEALPGGTKKVLGDTFEQHGEGPLPALCVNLALAACPPVVIWTASGLENGLTLVQVIEINWRKFIVTPDGGGTVTHPEHPPLQLPPNTIFEVSRVRSVTPYID